MIRWQPLDRRIRSRPTIRRLGIGALIVAGLSALAVSPNPSTTPLIVYNASASIPLGYYRVQLPKNLKVGDLVLVQTPPAVRELADTRRYLPKSVPMMKHIAALNGAEVCARSDSITIDGRVVARRWKADHLGRPMPWWQGCRTLRADQVFLLNADVPQSFDGRYFGVVTTALIIGKVTPL